MENLKVKTKVVLSELCNPIKDPSWGVAIKPNMVLLAMREKRFRPSPVLKDAYENPIAHAERIAWLAIYGWADPIEIDVGVPGLNCFIEWPVTDGNHRLYAAFIRNQETVLVNICGDVEYASSLLNLDQELL